MSKIKKVLKKKCSKTSYEKIKALKNNDIMDFIGQYVMHCNPESVFIRGGSAEDEAYIRDKALRLGEEESLATEGHSIHFDGINDQARDKENTKYLLPEGQEISKGINKTNRSEGLKEVKGFLENSMEGKEMMVGFFCLGPTNSEFSLLAVQITDSSYVMHSEGILYRNGYNEFLKEGKNADYFKFVHTAGELENNVSKNIDKRRVYIDLERNTVYSTNTQYAGNTVGLKKLAMRLAIKKASNEGWLTEHMFVMGSHGPGGRVTYFTGAFPSACGKTSTAMMEGETIVGDDIAYLREVNGELTAVNVENGIFGIIRDVDRESQSVIWDMLTAPGEVIFSNVLVKDGKPYWLGDGRQIPDEGKNYSGKWNKGKTGENGSELTLSHKNARFTVGIGSLDNRDEKYNAPEGVPVGGVIYGGRDSDTCVPVEEAFSWQHGILTKGATIESETTAATLGKEGVRKFNLMSNLDFLAVPIGKYLENNCDIVKKLEKEPKVFSVNYFLKGDGGKYLNGIQDKRVWLKWMELRVHSEVKAIKTPTGYIPFYEDLKKLFKEVLDKDYSKEDYKEQFTIRVPEYLNKIERIVKIYKDKAPDAPGALYEELEAQKTRLKEAASKYGDYMTPDRLV
ncbi:MAG: phosphoenolpyruvate carboxykinase (GTP) [Elusimicrobia bacterium]|jgi:phosphoenolpyruvate carboxykinase (GTP)|nr:phosphoenolpyruvate carboxykinase (GTP) [Elusimicrobiota bacterium]